MVKKQWTKLQVLTCLLPKEITDEIRPLLRKKQAEWGRELPYKKVKDEILRIFAPNQTAAFDRAYRQVLSGKPSTLARQLTNDLCKHNLDGCCCANIILGFWRKQLPLSVRNAIAHLKFDKDTYHSVLQHADDVFDSNQSNQPVVASVTRPAPVHNESHVSNTAFNRELPGDVAAVQRGRGRGGRGFRGGRGGRGQNRGARGAGSGGQSSTSQETPPSNCCWVHKAKARNAWYCAAPFTCPWKNSIVPRPASDSTTQN